MYYRKRGEGVMNLCHTFLSLSLSDYIKEREISVWECNYSRFCGKGGSAWCVCECECVHTKSFLRIKMLPRFQETERKREREREGEREREREER